jgi:hypothetical protein
MRISESNLRRVIRHAITEMYDGISTIQQDPETVKKSIETFLGTSSAEATPVTINGKDVSILPRTAGIGKRSDTAIVTHSKSEIDISGEIKFNTDGKYYIEREQGNVKIPILSFSLR